MPRASLGVVATYFRFSFYGGNIRLLACKAKANTRKVPPRTPKSDDLVNCQPGIAHPRAHAEGSIVSCTGGSVFVDLLNVSSFHCFFPRWGPSRKPSPCKRRSLGEEPAMASRTTTSSTPSPQTPATVLTPVRGERTGMSTSGVRYLGFCLIRRRKENEK